VCIAFAYRVTLSICQGYNSSYSTDSAEESEQERTRKAVLGKLARKRFEAMLRGVSGKRGEIARCMTFSLEHAEAAREVWPQRPNRRPF
jgi:U2-associated protein SR140